MRRIGYWKRPINWSSAVPPEVVVTVELREAEAQALANFLGRMEYEDWMLEAEDRDEGLALAMAGAHIASALKKKGSQRAERRPRTRRSWGRAKGASMSEPRSLAELVRADLERAQRLIRKVHPDPIDPQFRIASPEGDWWIAITLTENAKERTKRLALVSDFMAWKLSPGFILASELHEPDAVLTLGLQHKDYYALIALIERKPLGFSAAKFVKCENMDPVMLGLLPRGSRTITKSKARELAHWFGAEGRFPAVKIATGEIGG